MQGVSPMISPSACTGSGGDGGRPFDTDGLFFINSATRAAAITDGLSRTVAFAESLLGDAATTTRAAVTAANAYAFVMRAPLSAEMCGNTAVWNFSDPRGFSWANGEYRTTLYNHARRPNDPVMDCMGVLMTPPADRRDMLYAAYGWRAARSRHPGGVQVALADGGTRFVSDAIDAVVWQASSTRAGGEVASLP